MEEYIWKILHVQSGLFYCSQNGRFTDQLTNLSNKGNLYTSEKTIEKVLNDDSGRDYINKAKMKSMI